MSKKLSRAPVFFTIIQARFNAIPKLNEFAPSIQEKFGKCGYSDSQTSILRTLNISFATPSDSSPQQEPINSLTQFTSSNFKLTESLILDHSSLTLQTTEYDTFEKLSKSFLDALRIVHELVGGIAFIDRLGLRYLNTFKGKNDEKITNYVCEGVVGLFDSPERQVSHTFTETVYKRENASVTARAILRDGPFGFPADVQPGSMTVGSRFKEIMGIHAMLDIDCSTLSREIMDWENVVAGLRNIHDQAEDAFKKLTTDRAREVWQ